MSSVTPVVKVFYSAPQRKTAGPDRAPPSILDLIFVYCVFVFTASPVLKPAPETTEHTAETSSTSVTFTIPMDVLMRRNTFPVAGSCPPIRRAFYRFPI